MMRCNSKKSLGAHSSVANRAIFIAFTFAFYRAIFCRILHTVTRELRYTLNLLYKFVQLT